MPRKRKLSNLADRCRFCLARDACMSELFAEWLRPKLEDLQKLSGIEISDKTNYPRKICYVCLYKLEMWNEFKGQFLKTNKTLITHFKIVEETVPEVNKSLDTTNDTVDDLLSDDNKKRPKIDSTNVIVESKINHSPLKTPEKVKSTKIDNTTLEPTEIEENAFSSIGKSPLSDNSASNQRRGRSKKIEREASTKRWEERQNALIAATGEVSSESESDNGSQLSPVQKARVKARNIEMEFERQKKIQKALKNLQTDLTEKYKVSYEDLVTTNERKTRSRQDNIVNNERKTKSQQETKLNIDDISITDNVKVNLLKSPLAEKKLEMLNIAKKDKRKVEQEDKKVRKEEQEDKKMRKEEQEDKKVRKEEQEDKKVRKEEQEDKKVRKKAEEKPVEVIQLEEESIIDITEDVNDQSNVIELIDDESDKQPEEEVRNESVNKSEIKSAFKECEELPKEPEPVKKLAKVVSNKKDENDIDVIDLDDIEDTDKVITNLSQNQENDDLFKPQELKSEVTLGNATYIVTTILDLPGSSSEKKSDISLKTNGLNIDATSQDGNKIDLMNAVELQKVQSKGNIKEDKTGQDVHQCLKIEIEGMEAQALQRVQLDLAHFVTDEIHQLLTEGESAKSKPKLNKYKDSYETLNHQLKAIVKKVLRSNFETDKLVASTNVNLRKFSPEFLQAASFSPVFQPQVMVPRLNIAKLCKIYNINNLHILEDAKRRRGVVGPLSRTLGKRRPVLPKKFEEFALSYKDELKLREEENKLKSTLKSSTSTTATNANSSFKPIVTIPSLSVANSMTLSTPVTKSTAAVKMTPASTNKSISVAKKSTTKIIPSIISKMPKNTSSKSSTFSANKTTITTGMLPSSTVVSKSNILIPIVFSTASQNRIGLSTPVAAKIRSEVPPVPVQKTTISEPQNTVNSLIIDWSDSDQSVNDGPIMKELSTSPFKHLQLPKIISKIKELPLSRKPDASASPVSITKPKSSMSVTKTTVSKASGQPTIQVLSNTTPAASKTVQGQQKASKPTITTNITTSVSQKNRHLCGICNKELFSEKEAEAHVKSHKIFSNQLNISPEAAAPKATPSAPAPSKPAVGILSPNKPALGSPAPTKPALSTSTPIKAPLTPGQPAKTKLMRCKRCQAIVEAEQVKSHVCNSIKFNCTICDCRFGAKHLLDTHMESTHQNQSAATTESKQAKGAGKEKQRVIVIQENKESKPEDKSEATLTNNDTPKPEGYSCFVCDKMFDDEVQMKEHLYMHSDEVSDDGDDKGFQCAFCYEKFQTEESLEAHVGNHLRDDGDEKINMLINLNTSRRERKRAAFKCEICTESFSTATLLATHMQDHEEEEAQDETEAMTTDTQQQNAEPESFVCTICDQLFESTDELSEHLDMHNGNAHVCILCEKPFSSIRDLQEHVSTHL